MNIEDVVKKELRRVGFASDGHISDDAINHYYFLSENRKEGLYKQFYIHFTNKRSRQKAWDVFKRLVPAGTLEEDPRGDMFWWIEPGVFKPVKVRTYKPHRYTETKVIVPPEGLRINLGAGAERIKGWKSLDLPPENVAEFGLMRPEGVLTPDIVATLPHIPLPVNSVAAYRSRDLLMHYAEEGLDFAELGREIKRTLKPGGVLITIENKGFERKLGRWLRIASIVPGRRVPYKPETRFLVTTYVKD